MMGSMLAFTLNDVAIKLTGGDIPLFQLIFLRGLFTTTLVSVLAWRMRAFQLRQSPRDWSLIGARVVTEVMIVIFFLTALLNMPIANVTAILQALPLIVTFAGIFLFKEVVGWRRMLAIALGFLGVMLIVKPGTDGFTTYTVFAMIAALFVALRDLVTKPLSAKVPSMLVTFCTATGITLVCGVLSLSETWVVLTPRHWTLLALSAVFILGGYLFSVLTIRVGDISFTALFRYTGILWALVLGLIVFDEWPDRITLLGVILVVGAGAYTLWREARVRSGS
ncbi:membrane protein [Pseudaestuariivita atlantica]|uniref:Membrane protein n=2 Tax=Pseudaestuariivita atlantica TaxID=1317121 RepID=A0A0L1JKS4_9RHOB|nr:membrane protein [Pseudaestuariivita atlantica]